MSKIKMPNRPTLLYPAILAGADVGGKPNYATIGACGVINLEPMLYISLKETHYTTSGVKENGYFSVNVPSADLARKTDLCGVVSGREFNKAELFTAFYDDAGKAPLIRECPINMLCKVAKTLPMSGFEMFFGEIVAVYINEDCLTNGKLDPLKVNPMVMMYPDYFALGQVAGAVYQDGMAYKKSLSV